jgi:hypothetical protein
MLSCAVSGQGFDPLKAITMGQIQYQNSGGFERYLKTEVLKKEQLRILEVIVPIPFS